VNAEGVLLNAKWLKWGDGFGHFRAMPEAVRFDLPEEMVTNTF